MTCGYTPSIQYDSEPGSARLRMGDLGEGKGTNTDLLKLCSRTGNLSVRLPSFHYLEYIQRFNSIHVQEILVTTFW